MIWNYWREEREMFGEHVSVPLVDDESQIRDKKKNTEVSYYDAANMLVTAGRPRLAQRRSRADAAPHNENPVCKYTLIQKHSMATHYRGKITYFLFCYAEDFEGKSNRI
jgi:hypothetical protein